MVRIQTIQSEFPDTFQIFKFVSPNYQIRGLLVMECQLPHIVAACPSPLGYVGVLPHGQTLTPNGAGPKPASEFQILGVETRIDWDISGSKDQQLVNGSESIISNFKPLNGIGGSLVDLL